MTAVDPELERHRRTWIGFTWFIKISMLVLIDGLAADDLGSFTRCVDLFDGNDPAAVEAARDRWSQAQAAGHSLTYWQQTEAGWEKKA